MLTEEQASANGRLPPMSHGTAPRLLGVHGAVGGFALPGPTLERHMRFSVLLSVGAASLLVLAGCVSLAPGADKIRVTKVASDVSSCTAVGNIKVPRGADGNVDIANADAEFRNQTVGLGGNTAFATAAPLGVPVEGIAYRCP